MPSLYTPRKTEKAFALVLVLMLVVLMAIMVVAIFSSVKNETLTSGVSSSGQTARQLSDLGVETCIAQIQRATTTGSNIAWASQPGMIRNYNNAGVETQLFKLYSSASMIMSSPGNALAALQADLPTGRWQKGGIRSTVFSPT